MTFAMIWRMILAIYLVLNSWSDLRKREVNLPCAILFGVLGMILVLWKRPIKIEDCFGGIMIGVFMLAVARLCGEAVGYGDGIVIVVCGIYLGFLTNFAVLFYAFLLCMPIAGVLLLKKGRKQEIPFVPFLMISYVLLWIGEGRTG